MKEKIGFYKSEFYIFDFFDNIFPGYTDGITWNGWACPYFEKDVAIEILTTFYKENVKFFYNKEEHAFIYTTGSSSNYINFEELKSNFSLCKELEQQRRILISSEIEILYNNIPIKVFDIGTCNWSWLE